MLPGIVKISYTPADSLPDFLLPVIPDDFLMNLELTEVDLADVGSLSEESTGVCLDFNTITKLEFTASEELPNERRLGFVVQDAMGNQYIIGNRPPHCGSLKRTAQVNEPSGKASIFYYSFIVPVPKYKL